MRRIRNSLAKALPFALLASAPALADQPWDGMTGGGAVFDGFAHYRFAISCDAGGTIDAAGEPEHVAIKFPLGERESTFQMSRLLEISCFGFSDAGADILVGTGAGTIDGQPGYYAHFIFEDGGEPGVGKDRATLIVYQLEPGIIEYLEVHEELITAGNNRAHAR